MKNVIDMTPRRPFFFTAIYDWLIENELTPYLLVDAMIEGVDVPQEFVSEGEIVLNLTPSAIENYVLNRDYVAFDARFKGESRSIFIPLCAVRALYAKENGVGLGFEEEPYYLQQFFGENAQAIYPKPHKDEEEKEPEDALFTLIK